MLKELKTKYILKKEAEIILLPFCYLMFLLLNVLIPPA